MKNRQRVRKEDGAAPAAVSDDTTATHRLSDISVSEVSIVDRAANKRKYLLVKEKPKDAESKEPATKDDQQPPAPPAPPQAPAPPTLRVSAELKAKVLGQLKTAQERIGVIQKVLEGASETPGAPPPQELMDALAQLASLFTDVVAPPAAPPQANPPTPAGAAEAGKSDTEKAGKKISAARLARLNELKTNLTGLIDELAGEPEGSADGEEKKPDAGASTTAEKGAGASAPPAAPPAPVPNPQLDQLQATVAGLVGAVEKMTLVHQSQNQRIEELAKSRGSSRQVDPDTTPKPSKPTVWELDLAAPTKTVA